MNILSKVTWQAMWKNKTRTIATLLGVVLSVALFTAIICAGVSGLDFLIRGEIYEEGDYFVALSILSEEEAGEIGDRPEVSRVADFQALGYTRLTEELSGWSDMIVAAVNEDYFAAMPVRLLEGRLPENSGEVVISEYSKEAFEYYGFSVDVGASLELDIATWYPDFEELYGDAYTVEQRSFEETYTVVGIMEGNLLSGEYTMHLEPILTLADGEQGTVLWHNQFIKTSPAKEVFALAEGAYGLDSSVRSGHLGMHGASKDVNVSHLLWGIVAVLCLIIMVGSVSLIYNAFSISLSERTKQFGLLSSVGATRKQLRQSMLSEAGILCALGIPAGLVVGWGGMAIVLHFMSPAIHRLFMYSAEGTVRLLPIFSVPALLGAALVALVTVYLSAWIPARRAGKIAPMEAIRQSGDYTVDQKGAKGGKLMGKLWGVPGLMASKYYRVSRKKYRATVLSLAVSVALMISAVSLGDYIRTSVSDMSNTENHDFLIYSSDRELLEKLRNLEGVEDSVYVNESYQLHTVISDDQYTQEYLEYWDLVWSSHRMMDRNGRTVQVNYVEDEVFRAYLEEQGIDPAPYFEEECPAVLVCNLTTTTPYIQNEKGEWYREYYNGMEILKPEVDSITLYPNHAPQELNESDDRVMYEGPTVTADGEMLTGFSPLETGEGIIGGGASAQTQWFLVRPGEVTEEGQVFHYYRYDAKTGTAEPEPVLSQAEVLPVFRLGARVSEPPFGIAKSNTTHAGYGIFLLQALSAYPYEDTPHLALKIRSISDYSTISTYLGSVEEISVNDLLEKEMNTRGMIACLDIFSYCFVILISLISATNVFNTISTNISLRRRDFGMLRSIGMGQRELQRMVGCECLIYGSRALIWGLSVGLLGSFGIHLLGAEATDLAYVPPYGAMVFAAVSVCLVVVLSVCYAIGRLKKDNPIDAIRMENL